MPPHDASDSPYAAPTAEVVDPSALDSGLVTAEPWRRFVAFLVNSLLWTVPIALIGVVGVLYGPEAERSGELPPAAIASVAVGLVLLIALTVIQSVLVQRNGWTLGKKLMGIRVVTDDGRPCGLARYFFLRYLLLSVGFTVLNLFTLVLGSIGQLVDYLMVFTERGLTLHDRVASTRCVMARRERS